MENTAIGYARLSKQTYGGLSIEGQEEKIRAYALLRGLSLEGEQLIVDNGVSGGIPLSKRKEGRRLVTPGVANVIVVRLDRIFRNTRDALAVVDAWGKAGVALHVVDMGGQSIDTRSAVGRVFFTMLSAFAQFERDLISERTIAALKVKRERGERVGKEPFGEGAGEGLVLQEMVAWRAQGETLREIADRLNARGVARKQGGQRWYASSVRAVLARKVA